MVGTQELVYTFGTYTYVELLMELSNYFVVKWFIIQLGGGAVVLFAVLIATGVSFIFISLPNYFGKNREKRTDDHNTLT